MARVILHIGTHKTATTTIQDMFAHNANLLAEHGVIYPRLGKITGHHGLVTDWVTTLPRIYAYPRGSLETLRQIAQAHAESDRTVFLSSEEFSRGTPDTRPDFTAIRAALLPFERIEVVCVLRAQWQFIQSVYLEVSKLRQPMRPPEFVEDILRTDMAEGLWTDYSLLYDHLRKDFAADEITFLDFDQCRRTEYGIIGAMLRQIGCALDPAVLEPVNDGKSNVSPKAVPAWAANIVAAPGPATPWLVEAVTGAFNVQFGAESQSCLWTPQEFQILRDYGAERNAALAERLKPVQPDFTLEAGPADTGLIHRDRLHGEFWVRASRWIFSAAQRHGAK